ncbi:MAG: hypothetical protein J5710_05420 [Treponema sp.]|nr:hypothetical protein [Treponema sp.]MBR5645870.1 hypothetical protein [Treponema sp.]
MEKSKKTISFVLYVTFAHVITYFICGVIFSQLMGYSEWWKQPVVCDYFRTFDGAASAAGPFIQIIRGLLYGLILIPLIDFIKQKSGWLKLWLLFVGIGIIGAPAAAPSSIEGVVYSKLPFAFHFVGLPEICSQTLLFSVLVYRHLNSTEEKSEKSKNLIRAFYAAIIVFMGYAVISIIFAVVQNVAIESGSADIRVLAQFLLPVIFAFVLWLINRYKPIVKIVVLYVLSVISFVIYQSLVLHDLSFIYVFAAPLFTTALYFLFMKICAKRDTIKE